MTLRELHERYDKLISQMGRGIITYAEFQDAVMVLMHEWVDATREAVWSSDRNARV